MNSFANALSNDSNGYADLVNVLKENKVTSRNHALDTIEDLKGKYEAASRTAVELTGLGEVFPGTQVIKAGKFGYNKIKGLVSGVEDDAPSVANNIDNVGKDAQSTFNNFKQMASDFRDKFRTGGNVVNPTGEGIQKPSALGDDWDPVGAGDGNVQLGVNMEENIAKKNIANILKSRGEGFETKINTNNSINRPSTGETKTPDVKFDDNLDNETKQQDNPDDESKDDGNGDDDGNESSGSFDWSDDEGDDDIINPADTGETGDEIAGGFFDAIGLPEIGVAFQIAGGIAGAGIAVADAVKSGIEGDAADKLRKTPLGTSVVPDFDVGGSVAAPTVSSINQ